MGKKRIHQCASIWIALVARLVVLPELVCIRGTRIEGRDTKRAQSKWQDYLRRVLGLQGIVKEEILELNAPQRFRRESVHAKQSEGCALW